MFLIIRQKSQISNFQRGKRRIRKPRRRSNTTKHTKKDTRHEINELTAELQIHIGNKKIPVCLFPDRPNENSNKKAQRISK